jgi:hypothetical protein
MTSPSGPEELGRTQNQGEGGTDTVDSDEAEMLDILGPKRAGEALRVAQNIDEATDGRG